MTTPNWYVELGVSPGAPAEEIAAAIERRSRQAAALANTAPERSQRLRDEVRAMKHDLLSGEENRQAYDRALGLPAPGAPTSPWSAPQYQQPAPDAPSLASAPPAQPDHVPPAEPAPAGDAGYSPGWPPPGDTPLPPGGAPYPLPGAAPGRSNKRVIAIAAAAVAVVGIGTVVAVAATSGGGSHKPAGQQTSEYVAAPTPVASYSAPAATESLAPSVPPTDTAAPAGATLTPTSATHSPGDVVLTNDQIATACGQTTGPFPDPNDDTSTIADGQWGGAVKTILDDGIVIGDCTPGTDGYLERVVAIDARTDTLLWSRPIASNVQSDTDTFLGGGNADLYLLTTTDHPAQGLQDEFWTRTVTGIDTHTGKTLWTKPILPKDTTSSTTDGSVQELSGAASGQTIGIVNVDGFTALDAATGATLWSRDSIDNNDNSASPTVYGRGVYVGYDDNGNAIAVGIDLASDRIIWRSSPGIDNVLDDNYEQVDGRTVWYIQDTSYAAFDAVTGKRVASGSVPNSFVNPLITPAYTVAVVGSQLRMYRTGQWATPLWTQPSDQVTPDAVTSRAVVVEAAAGTELVDAKTGAVLGQVDFQAQQSDVTDGLLQTDNGVVDLGAP